MMCSIDTCCVLLGLDVQLLLWVLVHKVLNSQLMLLTAKFYAHPE